MYKFTLTIDLTQKYKKSIYRYYISVYLFTIEDFLSISIILRSLTTFYEDWKRIGFSRMLDWYHLTQLKMTSAHYWGLPVRILLNS